MGIVVRQSIKTTIVTLFGAVLGAIIVLASTYLLPIQYYGFIKNITNQALTFSYFLLMGVPSTLIVYIHKFQEEPIKKKTLVGFSFLIPILTCSIFFIVYFFFPPYNQNSSPSLPPSRRAGCGVYS